MKENVTTIEVRLLEIKEDGQVVLVTRDYDGHSIGYVPFMLRGDDLERIMSSDNPKMEMYSFLVHQYNRSFLEFLMVDVNVDSVFLASVYVEDYDIEFSYLEAEYMEDTYLNAVSDTYSEEIGMLSDFDYYPRGLV